MFPAIWIKLDAGINDDMKKRTAAIGALVSLLPMGQPLVIGTGAILTSAAVLLSAPEKAQAESASFYYNRGNDKSDAGDYYGAISDYSKAIEINPRDAIAYYNRGYSKNELKDYRGAIVDFTKAIEINPRYSRAYTNRGFSKVKLGDNSGAISDFNKSIEINPKEPKTFINRGVSKFKIGDKKGACFDARKGKSLGASNGSKAVELLCQ